MTCLLMHGPRNVRRSRFHARDYGLLVANPFGRQEFTKREPSRVVVSRGETLKLRFGVLVRLYGLVRTGEREKAIRFLQETRSLSRKEAAKRVAELAADLGMS